MKHQLGEAAIALCKQFPNSSHRQLARMLHKAHPLAIKDEEMARSLIRYHRGALISSRGHKSPEPVAYNPYQMPKSVQPKWDRYEITGKKVGILNDLHIPYHDIPAINASLDWFKKEGIDTILCNGDILDFYQLSYFDKDPTQESFQAEIIMGREFFDSLAKAFPKVKIIYREGNHEQRLERYLMAKAPELFGIPEFSLNSLLDLEKRKIDWIADKRIISLGHLDIIHGHEVVSGISAPVNPARGLYLKAKTNAIAGHHHQTSEHTEKTMNGKIIGTWTIGCLCHLNPRYRPINNWNHGAAIVEATKNGDFKVMNRRILNGEML